MSEIPVQGIRSDQVYVEWAVRKAFTYLRHDHDEPIDYLINKVLKDWLTTNHPKVLEHLEQQKDKDRAFRDGYKAND